MFYSFYILAVCEYKPFALVIGLACTFPSLDLKSAFVVGVVEQVFDEFFILVDWVWALKYLVADIENGEYT